jgi:hypothetical protein
VYMGSQNGLYALDGGTGLMKWEFQTLGHVDSSAAIGMDGTIYVGSNGGILYALYGGAPLADSPWPMFGRDAQHTGRAGSSSSGRVSLELAAGKATIRWTGDFILQAASNVKGPWADLMGASSGYQGNSIGPCQFFRLRSK